MIFTGIGSNRKEEEAQDIYIYIHIVPPRLLRRLVETFLRTTIGYRAQQVLGRYAGIRREQESCLGMVFLPPSPFLPPPSAPPASKCRRRHVLPFFSLFPRRACSSSSLAYIRVQRGGDEHVRG